MLDAMIEQKKKYISKCSSGLKESNKIESPKVLYIRAYNL